jgi:uncharacterized OB-fold protein
VKWTYGPLEPAGTWAFEPEADSDSEPFWDNLARGQVTAQRCSDCGLWRFPPGPRCRRCQSAVLEWKPLESVPRLYSWIVVNRATHSDLAVPYGVCLAEFEEGVRIPGRLAVPVGTEEIVIDMELEAEVEMGETVPSLVFRTKAPHAVKSDGVNGEVSEV